MLGPQIKSLVTTKAQKGKTVWTEMFSVDGGTVTVCWTRQCPVVNCSIAEHQRQRRLGHQQLRTATGGHPASGSVISIIISTPLMSRLGTDWENVSYWHRTYWSSSRLASRKNYEPSRKSLSERLPGLVSQLKGNTPFTRSSKHRAEWVSSSSRHRANVKQTSSKHQANIELARPAT